MPFGLPNPFSKRNPPQTRDFYSELSEHIVTFYDNDQIKDFQLALMGAHSKHIPGQLGVFDVINEADHQEIFDDIRNYVKEWNEAHPREKIISPLTREGSANIQTLAENIDTTFREYSFADKSKTRRI